MPKVDLTKRQLEVLIDAAAQVEMEWEDEGWESKLRVLDRAVDKLASALRP